MFIIRDQGSSNKKTIDNVGVSTLGNISFIRDWNWWILCIQKGDGFSCMK